MTAALPKTPRQHATLRNTAGVLTFALAVLAGFVADAQMAAPPDPISITGPDPTERYGAIEITQQLDAQVPLDLEFVNEFGETVTIGDYLGHRPAILALVYYECPMLCTEVLNGLEVALKGMKYGLGSEYDVITVSIDPGETPSLAATKKGYHLERLDREGAEHGWHFLTTPNVANIDALADTVGFGYAYDKATDQYAHAAGIMVLNPAGRVSRYFYGIEYIPKHLEFGLIEASEGKIGNIVDRFTLLCYAYDPEAGAYNFEILLALRIGATLTILGFAAFWGMSYLQWRRNRNENGALPPEAGTTTQA